MSNIKDIWINQELNSGSITLREHFAVHVGFNCFVGRIGVSNAKMFQIELNESTPIHKNYLKRFHGVEIRVLDSKKGKKDVTIILSDNDLIDVFILFLEDLISSLKNLDNENSIPLILNEKVGYWGKLFAKIKGELLSKERQRGLYGELIFLNTLLNSSNDFVKTISSWTGPEGSNQDFSNGLSAVEVKSSRATKPTVNIASELQLDWTILDNLFLHVIHLDELSNGSDTLKKLIEGIKQKVAKHPNLLRLFEEKLDLSGIPLGEEKHYDEIEFIIRSQRVFKVQNGFPVLINDTINNEAIHNVKYQIDLTALEPFETELESVISKMI
ncbi:PD-(D/E)XK motif protein [Seonamhaeicola sp. ML3]|uniref:PD-(D/E)XK motif protein n=1 Tax=Seonamhaeicola sp. ML3 TaxID=2937786 RepID=UPI00200C13EB|nr:PD-(D/E)XK motif protein [Seonamhaeicola sp. ML3]